MTVAIPSRSKEDVFIRILGARGSGKTTFLYKLYFTYNVNNPDEPLQTFPTETFNVEVIPYRRLSLRIWDFAEISTSLNYLKDNTRVLVYFVDAVAQNRKAVADKARENMLWLLEQYGNALRNTIIITVANKHSEEGAMDVQDIGQMWVADTAMRQALQGHHWRIFPCDALHGNGIAAILDYITRKLHEPTHIPQHAIDDPSASHHLQVTPWESIRNANHLTDSEFYAWFYQGSPFLFFDHYCLLRIIYLTLRRATTAEKRTHATQKLLEHISATLHHVARLKQDVSPHMAPAGTTSLSSSRPSIVYSETQILFWFQMVSFAILKHPILEGEDDGFESFLAHNSDLTNTDAWRLHYSSKLFHSEKAAQAFIPPDKKPLPNAFKAASVALEGSGLKIYYKVL